jgi:hypothetical protein
VDEKKEKNCVQFDIFNLVAKPKISFQCIGQHARFIWDVISRKNGSK